MTREIIDINDFTVLLEEARSDQETIDTCAFEEPLIGIAFYGSGNVNLTVQYGDNHAAYDHTKGFALSFYADERVEFIHKISASRPLQCIVIATAVRNLDTLPFQGGKLFGELLNELVRPKDHFVMGPSFYMTPEMQSIVDQLFHIKFEGQAKMMFFRGQITSLLAHFFGQLSLTSQHSIPAADRGKLQQARDILLENLDHPPSLSQLSRQIGLNTFKLKKNFKELFGVPVFKYLQNERLNKAHELLRNQGLTIQEAAWQVGYDSLSSFSTAFLQKFGVRPSEIKK